MDATASVVPLFVSGRPETVRLKGDRDVVTDLDVRIQAGITEYLSVAAPGIGALGEENTGGAPVELDAEWLWVAYGRPAALEEDLYPLLVLHGLLRSCGLLRLRHGVLAPTRAARDDLAAVRRLRTLFEPHAFTTVLTELTTAALAVHGPIPVRDLGGRIFPLLGGGWVRNGMPLTALDVQLHLEQQRHLMSALDLIDTRSQNTWAAGSSAQSLLPGAALLTHTWTSHRDAALDG